ncbi:MAG TPA: MBG domain-containing protein, partial [Planctomycetota bacterium]|nr:MBG domain-containing protein [Planctomycetota bacterium]
DAVNFTLSTTATQLSGVAGSPYAIAVSLGANPNYNVTPIDGTLTVDPVVVTVTAHSKVKTYGDPNPALDATSVGDVAGGDAVNFTLSTTATPFSSVAGSPYAIVVNLGANPNYTVTPVSGALTIDPKVATVTANNKVRTYGDGNQALDATVVGEVSGGDAVNFTLSTTATPFSSVAGSPYAIVVNLGANPNYTVTSSGGTLTIDPRAATVTANNKVRAYGDGNQALDATVVGEVIGGDAVNYTLSTTATQFSSVAGSPYAIAVNLGSNPNYTVTPVGGTLTIDPALVTVTANNKVKTYGDGNPAFDATVVGEVAGGDAVNFTLSTPATQLSGVAGSPYAIAVSLGANPNYSITPINGALTIHPKAATVTANNEVKTYGDLNPAFDATVVGEVAGGDAVNFTLSTTATQLSGVAGSPYAIAVNLGSNPNYNVTPISGALTIGPKAATVTANHKVKTYGDLNPAFDATVVGQVAGGDAVSFTLSTTATQFSGVAGSPYTIAVSLGSNPNYNVTPTYGTLTIDPKAATVTANNKSKIYGALNPALDATVAGEVAGGAAVSFTLSTTATQFSGVAGSPYAIAVSLGANPNYSVTPIAGALAIGPKAATVTANNKSKTYGALNPALDATVGGQVAGGDAVNYTLSTSATQFSSVASSPFAIAVSLGSNPNYSVTPIGGTLTIDPKAATVTANNKSKIYGALNPALDATVVGEVAGGDAVNYTLSTTATQFSGVAGSPYAIAVNLGSNPNYAVTPVDGALTIAPALATVTANNKVKTYGDLNPNFDATVAGAVAGGDAVNYSLSTTATQFSGVAGSPYAITVNLGSNPNYSVTQVNGALAIDPKAATVTANNKVKTYGDLNPALDAIVVGEVAGGDSVNFTLSTTATQFSSVAGSPYAIAVNLGSNPNYIVTPTDGALTIDPKVAMVIANNKVKFYGDLNPAFDATVAGEVAGGDALNYTLSTTAWRLSTVAGSPYQIAVSLGSNPNYTVTAFDGALTIDPRDATVTANNKVKTYGDLNPALDATVVGTVVGGSPVNFALSTTATQFSSVAGSPYAIAVSLGSNPNYNITPIDGALTIDPALATVTANNKVKTYGALNPTLDATVVGAVVGGSPVNFALSTTATQFSGVAGSPYAIAVNLGSNPNYSVTPNDGALAVNPASTSSALAVAPTSVQYSDLTTFTATLSPGQIGGNAPATGVQFLLDGNAIGGVRTLAISGGGLTASLVVGAWDVLPVAPGSYSVTAVFTGASPNFAVSTPAAAALTVARESARAAYTGATYVSTASATSSTATVLLSATIQDITAVLPGSDPDQGDIRNATVTFIDRDANLPIATVPVSLVSPLDVKTGTATYSWNVDLGTSDGRTFMLGIVVGNHYTRNAGDDNTIVTVKKATPESIGGAGYLVNTASAGPITATPGLMTNFGMNVKFNKTLTSLQGNVNVIVRSNGLVYQIKGPALGLLSVVPNAGGKTFKFTSGAILRDITDPLNPVPLGSNLLMQVKATDLGSPGNADTVGFALTNPQGTILFASNWNGTAVAEQVLGGGNIEVR